MFTNNRDTNCLTRPGGPMGIDLQPYTVGISERQTTSHFNGSFLGEPRLAS